jgi:prepilin-type N-terminal cleavage/methylation domain-containing protein/prepilin-type processing-associated H-X9-DG protein
MQVHTTARSGFTLIELLVVISIIALLIAILLPALGAARDMSEQAKCLAHQRGMGQALTMYANDDESDHYPGAGMMGHDRWYVELEPYIFLDKFYHCPSDQSELWVNATRQTSYGINGYITHNHPPYWGLRFEDMFSPSATILVAELNERLTKDHIMPMVWGDPPAHPGVLTGMMTMARNSEYDDANDEVTVVQQDRHFAKSNYVFGDGHAAVHAFDETWQQTVGSNRAIDLYDPKFSP